MNTVQALDHRVIQVGQGLKRSLVYAQSRVNYEVRPE